MGEGILCLLRVRRNGPWCVGPVQTVHGDLELGGEDRGKLEAQWRRLGRFKGTQKTERTICCVLTWNRWPAWRRVAGLRGATGLRVLQKWMLDSRGLGVSNRVGVWGERLTALCSVFILTLHPWGPFQEAGSSEFGNSVFSVSEQLKRVGSIKSEQVASELSTVTRKSHH